MAALAIDVPTPPSLAGQRDDQRDLVPRRIDVVGREPTGAGPTGRTGARLWHPASTSPPAPIIANEARAALAGPEGKVP